VLSGNRVEVQLPSGSEGQEVNVFIVLPTTSLQGPQNPTALLPKMAEDPEIQSEMAVINAEFAVSQMDGLVIE
jgi:hypothetical protein